MKRITDKMRLDWLEADWTPRQRFNAALALYEQQEWSIRECIDAAIAASKGKEWWCERCQMVLDGIHVTFDEKHDASNCGEPVQWREKTEGRGEV